VTHFLKGSIMATKTVVIEVTTKPQEFPVGTVDGLFKFELVDVNGFVLSSVDTASPGASFPLVPDGATYTARVSKNGLTIEKSFTIDATSATLQVPDVITITISA
jgi:hypothetical protein